MSTMNIVIIEDESITASDLAATIKKVEPTANIVAMPGSVHESVEFFLHNTTHIDLIFSDIQLGDGLSFEIFKKVDVKVPVIFCTAYDEYALNAFKVSSIHYMLKPFSVKTVAEALEKFLALKSHLSHSGAQYDQILNLLTHRKKQSSLLVYRNDKIVPIPIDSIALFYIENEITYLLTTDQKNFSIQKTLEELEGIAGENFYRANRQFLVNRKAIKDTSQYFGRKLALNLHIPFSERITVSKTKVTEFLEWLAQY